MIKAGWWVGWERGGHEGFKGKVNLIYTQLFFFQNFMKFKDSIIPDGNCCYFLLTAKLDAIS